MQQKPHNGIPASRLKGAVWRKSQRSNSQGQCVEMARLDDRTVAVRNSRDPEGTALIFDVAGIREMIQGLSQGRFDDLA
jgi:Domain of unknown function (DUF397)